MPLHQHYWWPVVGRASISCSKCPGKMEFLKVLPARSKKYVNEIYLCDTCKAILF